MLFLKWWCPLALSIVLLSCQPTPEVESTLQPVSGKTVILLDSTAAAAQIQTDEKEGFFKQISPLDMLLQMHLPTNTVIDAATLHDNYQAFLARQAMPFEAEERALLKATLQQAYAYCDSLNPQLLPDTVYLAKMETDALGPSVYFTRERAVFIPQNELYEGNRALLPVLLHELFHIISRYQSDLRSELYRLIGYEQLDASLHFPTPLLQRRLLNPDGIDHRYAIELTDSTGQAQSYVSVITADTTDTYPGKSYFDYIDFRLYPLAPTDSGYTVLAEGVKPEAALGFFDQIADNTGYIIHPDEILADNFVLLVLRHAGVEGYTDLSLSKNGEVLLSRMEAALRK
ncbi:MAG: hypothetical protein RIC19_13870 [Phaeodactylibacter sp.]|uniref:hypothetical protein n=1 Tax=Phaeodactylibacter sp. TaxID=1940289 RepID=UPI0032EFFF81